ncbi:hypothetical protein TNCV_4254111 [Trichonephila clavipes]|nr:hypothetical protein TNCV_4254111 [Trichonephila clavipes]
MRRKFDENVNISLRYSGDNSSLVIKITDSWQACHEFEPSTDETPSCIGDLIHIEYVEAQTSSPWSARSELTTDIPLALTMLGVSYTKEDKGNKRFW